MRAQAARYTAGQTIEIRFDPENPSVSTVRTATLSTRARATRIAVSLLFMGMLVAAWFRFRAGEH